MIQLTAFWEWLAVAFGGSITVIGYVMVIALPIILLLCVAILLIKLISNIICAKKSSSKKK